jgi:allantoin racemase
MRLLIVNPNTSDGVTAQIGAAARAVALPDETIMAVSAASGPRLIVTDEDAEQATIGVLQALKDCSQPFDAIILGSFGDTGAASVRAAYPTTPVLGIAEAACLAARSLDGPFSIVTFTSDMVPSLWKMAEHHDVLDALQEIKSIPGPLAHDPAMVADALAEPLLALCLDCVARGAHGIVLGGGPIAGLASRLQSQCPVPIIDGTQTAVLQLRRHLKDHGGETDL